MAPLGILTIIVSAIRVGGPSWLKAIIGRARENLAAAEVELMSSTSVDVCELWNGSEIVRSLGSPPVREFILLLPKNRKDGALPTGNFDFECKNFREAERDGFLTTSSGIGDSEKGMNSRGIEPQNSNRSEKVIIIYNESTSAPNISLNVHPQKRAEVRAAAVIGTFLQLGVLIYAGFATYYHTLRFPKEENKPVSNYAFPCTASGTIILVTGLLLCADVVEKRTVEMARKPRAGHKAYAIWLQRQATVGDQVFKSFGIFSDEPRKEVVTSRRGNLSTVASASTGVSFVDRILQVICYLPFRIRMLFELESDNKMPLFTESSVQFSKTTTGAFLSICGYVVQFVGLRDMHWSVSIVQLGAVVFMTAARAAIRRGLAVPPRAQSLSQYFELEWLASSITGTGGSRWELPKTDDPVWINWVVLGDEGVKLESHKDKRNHAEGGADSGGERNQGGSQDNRESIEEKDGEESEDDIEYYSEDDSESDSDSDSKDDGQAIIDKKEGINDSGEKTRRESTGDVVTFGGAKEDATSNQSGDMQSSHGIDIENEHQSDSAAASNDEGHTSTIYSKPQTVMMLRSYFAKVTGWRSPVFAEANSLSRAMEVVMNTLFLKSRLRHFDWQFQAMCNNSDPHIITVPMSLVSGNWQVSRHDIEATLSLWIFSMKKSLEKDTLQNIDITTDRPGVHLLGLDTPQLRRDLRWWVPQDLKKAIVVRESPEGSLVVDQSLVVGCGRATQQAVKLERRQLGDDECDPPYGPTVERGFLAVESFRPPATLYALDLFSSFMSAVAREMERPMNGQGEVRPNDPGNLGSWTSFTLHNTLLSQMAVEIQSTGLATLSEVYSAIIPPLSIENKLPIVDSIFELAREHAKPQEERGDMKKVTEVYVWLARTARLFPPNTSFVPKSTAVILEHLDQLIKSTELANRLKPIASTPGGALERMVRTTKENLLRELIENELQLGNPESRNLLIRLIMLYDYQLRSHILPYQFIEAAWRDPGFLQQGLSAQRNPLREYEEGAEKRDITGQTQLHRDATRGYDYELAKQLESDIDPNTRDLLGQTALHLACKAGKIGNATILTSSGADINARARNRSIPLHYAAESGNLSIVKRLVESGAEFDAMDSAGMTPAMWAALEGHMHVLKYLLTVSSLNLRDSGGRVILHFVVISGSTGLLDVWENIGDPEVRDRDGRTPLHLAALHGNEEAFSKLIANPEVDKDPLDYSGKHLLHLAAAGGQLTIMDTLIRKFNADVNCVDKHGETPLHLAVCEGNKIAIEALMKQEANLEARNNSGETPLMVACILGRIEIVKRLVVLGANRDTLTDFGSSILKNAVSHGHRKVVEYLLSQGVDIDRQDIAGRTALHSAAMGGKRKIVALLIAAGAEKEMPDYSRMTPLHHAAKEGYSAVARALLMAGADKEAVDKRGMTPLQYAAAQTTAHYKGGVRRGKFGVVMEKTRDIANPGREKVVRLLLRAGVDRKSVNKLGKTARQLAEEAGKQRVVEMLDTIQAKR
ncbi:ankyrin repeat [Fusarium mundagurra]|uniref:Ankyrin repeat n=1 Tax=Fusarium mundagurra TaxID=1567541 RepID=A0A8H6DB65_9HYPO|nr:ankyrin repeat [Fusarium mundagurra]